MSRLGAYRIQITRTGNGEASITLMTQTGQTIGSTVIREHLGTVTLYIDDQRPGPEVAARTPATRYGQPAPDPGSSAVTQ